MGFDTELFAARLRSKRAEKKISQSVLAAKTGVCADTIAKYESGGYRPGSEKIYALAAALGCTPNYLMGWDQKEPTFAS